MFHTVKNATTDHIMVFLINFVAMAPIKIPSQVNATTPNSGSNEVLKLMRRRYARELFADKVRRIKSVIPQAFIGVDVIVGMRGETDELFRDSYDFLNGLDVTQLHVFSYSERPGTAALKIPHKVSPQKKRERSRLLMELSDSKTRRFYTDHTGREALVLAERPQHGAAVHGFTENYIRVEFDSSKVQENSIVKVRLGGLNQAADALTASII
jgi:threonylcarbamoyladenosine tRNA methylthiotransferase MtaB